MSGSSRIAALKALANDQVSCQTSLWLIIAFLGSKINSIGSSIVIICSALVSFKYSIIATKLVDFHEPVGQVTK
jgi:hypothetical protein